MDVQELLKRVGENLSVGRAFGTAYERDGALIVPVALVVGGGGGGGEIESLDRSSEARAGTDDDTPSGGTGGGYGGMVMPTGVYVVKDGSAKWVPAVNANLIILGVLATLRLLIRSRRRARRRRD
jgi:uncharacterized spore protein YtfJ